MLRKLRIPSLEVLHIGFFDGSIYLVYQRRLIMFHIVLLAAGCYDDIEPKKNGSLLSRSQGKHGNMP